VRITDVTVVLHERSASGAASFGPAGRRIPLGVLRLTTDEGVEGNAFLSSPGPGPAQIADQIVAARPTSCAATSSSRAASPV
jgi:hypothetical protein